MQSGILDVANAGWWNEIAHALTWTLVHSLWVGEIGRASCRERV